MVLFNIAGPIELIIENSGFNVTLSRMVSLTLSIATGCDF